MSLRESLGKVGLWIGSAGASPTLTAGQLAQAVERLGIRALWVGGGNPDDAALQERGAMLAATGHLVVATGITNIWAWDADVLYERAVALERAYPGRFLLGLGVSHEPFVRRMGLTYAKPLAAMREFLDRLDRAGAAAGAGPAPPRVLAALGPKMLELARERSVGAHPYLVTPQHTAIARSVLGAGPLLAPEQAVVVRRDVVDARRSARQYLATYLVLPNYLASLAQFGFDQDDFADGGSDRLVDELVPNGDATTVARRILEHLAAGADHVCVQALGEGRSLDLPGIEALLAAIG